MAVKPQNKKCLDSITNSTFLTSRNSLARTLLLSFQLQGLIALPTLLTLIRDMISWPKDNNLRLVNLLIALRLMDYIIYVKFLQVLRSMQLHCYLMVKLILQLIGEEVSIMLKNHKLVGFAM